MIDGPICDEFIHGNICDPDVCHKVIRGAHTVFHFAANMGGMGTIHEENDFIIYRQNSLMTTNVVEACVSARVQRLFYASSACVYPESLQSSLAENVSLRESDVWSVDNPPKPQGLYGFEKLQAELLIQQLSSKIDIRIARFHNIYGPGGAWNNGREKVPAALLRKALARRIASDSGVTLEPFELWGDGSQRRSFLYIDDAVGGIMKLLDSSYSLPVNIGSDASVTVKELADLALGLACFQPEDVPLSFDVEKPVGVACRNSNNDLVQSILDWVPTISLEEGMKRTAEWIRTEMDQILEQLNPGPKSTLLKRMQQSQLLDLSADSVVFAIILPVTSRGQSLPGNCLVNLERFAESLNRTTWRDTRHVLGEIQYRIKIYLAIDADDEFLLEYESNKAEKVLTNAGFIVARTLVCDYPRGHICKLWRDCAEAAWKDRCDYMVLMGDDVSLEDEGWMREIHSEFLGFSQRRDGIPLGFGCVAFTDITFPGMPTFPVIHRTHLDIFKGSVVPPDFINQDGDPFLYQLYRRWGCSSMITSRISNGVGGGVSARYEKKHVQDWTFKILDHAVSEAERWLRQAAQSDRPLPPKLLTLDIVIPCFRVDLGILDRILQLENSDLCSTMFIVIVDDPKSPNISVLNQRYAHRPDVRIRVNPVNSGASYSRNRGIEESSADWVHFLDDDIIPAPDLLLQAEHAIRAHPNAAGFVGNTSFPPANTIFTTALHLSGVTHFWDIASKFPDDHDVPWGVTANIITRRNVPDGVKFDLMFPKTGGGEDIDFCRKKRAYSIQHGGEGFFAAPEVEVTHPWWKNGARSYWRFYMWSVGDGALVKLYPEHCYRVSVPNSAEMALFWVVAGLGTTIFHFGECPWFTIRGLVCLVLANVVHDVYRHLYRDAHRYGAMNSNIIGIYWVAAIIESSLIRMVSEMGRLRGMLARKEFAYLGKRFDWFAGRWGDKPLKEEVQNGKERFALMVIILVLYLAH
ncbi:NAD-dependent epimerase/dehydratase [Rhodocollybia butyracea]|uniref:NAD-dependent epimerase/dehydratase n=1 Tax=Rhodocollybia butyracea TaxID=206335 RepID=A0A9P5PRV5_9AGAR|nr:NAD-dependent epimerase/dehydratase [Rhodocollybia butyracea]